MKKILFVFFAFLFFTSNLKAQWMTIQDTLMVINFENQQDSVLRFQHVSGTSWQIGTPQKTILDSAYSYHQALITDTTGYYQPGTYTVMDIPFVPNADTTMMDDYICPLILCFQHKMDIVTGEAGGWVEIWDEDEHYNVIELSLGSNYIYGYSYFYLQTDLTNFYQYSDTLFNGQVGFRNSDTTWKESCIDMYFFGVTPPPDRTAPDTLYYRFIFASDTVADTTHEGWMIDDIIIGKGPFTCGGGVEENDAGFSVYPNPTMGEIYFFVENLPQSGGPVTIRVFDTKGILRKTAVYAELPSSINIVDLPKGLYLLDIQTEKTHIRKRIVYP